jgi:hypothetical protein
VWRQTWRRQGLPDDLAHRAAVILGLLGNLMVVFVEIEQRVQLRLARDQILDPRFMLEWLDGLGLVVGQVLFQSLLVFLLLIGKFVDSCSEWRDPNAESECECRMIAPLYRR